jgi:hypothetical protein
VVFVEALGGFSALSSSSRIKGRKEKQYTKNKRKENKIA